jgi:hypothetical protein
LVTARAANGVGLRIGKKPVETWFWLVDRTGLKAEKGWEKARWE